MDDLLQDFLVETEEHLGIVDNELVRFERDPNDAEVLGNIFRLIHTIKGSCGFVGLPRLETLAHAAEALLGGVRCDEVQVSADVVTTTLATIDRIRVIMRGLSKEGKEPEGDDADLIDRLVALCEGSFVGGDRVALPAGGAAEAQAPAIPTVRVSVELLEELMTGVAELVLSRNQLMQQRGPAEDDLTLPLERLSAQIGRLRDGILRTRMQPISGAWNVLPRMVRGLGLELGKKIELVMDGGATELDRQMLQLLKDPLAHMVRNAADHGIETPQERLRAGKRETGRIRLVAAQEGGQVVIQLSDDGRGLDFDRLRKTAVETGHMSEREARGASEAQLARLIFAAGFSTAGAVTSISGRGVGMDVVRAHVEKVGGTIDVTSTLGGGTSIFLQIPLTLAIIPALVVGSGGDRYAIPQRSLVELVRTGERSGFRIETQAGVPVMRLRGQQLPLVDLASALGTEGAVMPDRYIAVMRSGDTQFGLVIDDIFDTEELVVKPLSRLLAGIGPYSGNAILGDGSPVLILDANGLAAEVQQAPEATVTPEVNGEIADFDRETMLLFRSAGQPQRRAVPLALVTRIEAVGLGCITPSGERHMLQWQGRSVPLVATEGAYECPTTGSQLVLLLSEGDDILALAIDEIVDVVESEVEIDAPSDEPSVLGAAVLGGQACELLDVSHYLDRQFTPDDGAPAVRPKAGARILLIDDNAFHRNLLKPLLRAAGYSVMSAPSADAARRLQEAGEVFDVVLSHDEEEAERDTVSDKARRPPMSFGGVPLLSLSALAAEQVVDLAAPSGGGDGCAMVDRPKLIRLLTARMGEAAA